jgi:hypothetical protein
MDTNQIPGVLTFYVSNTSGTYNIHNEIPNQTLHLRNVRVQFTTFADARSTGVIYFDASFLNSNLLIDGLPNLYLLPIPLRNDEVTQYSCDIPIRMSGEIKQSFNYRIVTSSGVAPTNIESVFLQFAMEKSLL